MGVVFCWEMFSTINFVIFVCIFNLLSKSLICLIAWEDFCEMTCGGPVSYYLGYVVSVLNVVSVMYWGWDVSYVLVEQNRARQAPSGTPVSKLKDGHVKCFGLIWAVLSVR